MFHDAQLADKHIQYSVQQQAIGICCGPVCMAGKHDLHHAVQQLDASGLSGHRHIGVLQVPACKQSSVLGQRMSILPAAKSLTVPLGDSLIYGRRMYTDTTAFQARACLC